MKAGEAIPAELTGRMVSGVNLSPGSLGDQLTDDVTLLIFLRHFGCIFCRETLTDMREYAEKDSHFPRALFFYQGSPTEGRAFLRRYWPELRAVADPEQRFYQGFGVDHGGLVKMFGPKVWSARSKAKAKGHENGDRSGDIWRMPGAYLVQAGRVIWAHQYRHAADHPSYEEISSLAASASGAATPA